MQTDEAIPEETMFQRRKSTRRTPATYVAPRGKKAKPGDRDTMIRADVAATKTVRRAIRIHSIKNGDVVTLLAGSRLATDLGIERLAQALGKTGRPDCIIAVVSSHDEMSVITDEAMQGLGWQRVKDFELEVGTRLAEAVLSLPVDRMREMGWVRLESQLLTPAESHAPDVG